MTNKIPKAAYQILLGFLMLIFTVVACNNKKDGDKKDTPADTTAVKPAEETTPAPADTTKKGTVDTVKEKPIKDPI